MVVQVHEVCSFEMCYTHNNFNLSTMNRLGIYEVLDYLNNNNIEKKIFEKKVDYKKK